MFFSYIILNVLPIHTYIDLKEEKKVCSLTYWGKKGYSLFDTGGKGDFFYSIHWSMHLWTCIKIIIHSTIYLKHFNHSPLPQIIIGNECNTGTSDAGNFGQSHMKANKPKMRLSMAGPVCFLDLTHYYLPMISEVILMPSDEVIH